MRNLLKHWDKWLPITTIIITALVFSRALFNDFVLWDDDFYILENHYIRNFSLQGIRAIFTNFYSANYHPLTTLTYLIEYKIFGLNPQPYHLFNLVLHLANTWLVFVFIKNLNSNTLPAIIVSAFFALHPMHVESVAWVSERKDVLYAFFFLLALICYLKYLENKEEKGLYLLFTFSFIAALLSKSAAVTLPIVFILIDFYKRRKFSNQMLFEKIPHFSLSLIFGILAIYAQQADSALSNVFSDFTVFERLLIHTYALSFYLIQLVLPLKLSAIHFYPISGHLPWTYFASPILLIVLVFVIFLIKNQRRELLFSVSFFLITISVMFQFIPVGNAVVAERYTYIPYIGLLYFAAIQFQGIKTKAVRNVAFTVLIIFLVGFSFLTVERIKIWKNSEALFSDVTKKYPDAYQAYYFRGKSKNNKGDFQGALDDFNTCLSKMPSYVPCLTDKASLLIEQGKFPEALENLNMALEVEKKIAQIYMIRGLAYDGMGNISNALNDYNKAINLNPNSAETYVNRGIVFINLGKIDSALIDFNKAIYLRPDLYMIYNNRGMAFHKKNNFTAAIEDYNKAISMKPDYAFAFNNRGKSKFAIGDINGAINDYNTSLEFNPNNAFAYYNRAELFFFRREFNKAISDLNKCLEIKNDFSDAYFLRGTINKENGNIEDACQDWKTAALINGTMLDGNFKAYCEGLQ
ncbi:MAG: tetratricopeptide repeat protein [Bacteroidales bacterium]|nr:tetratricopeptide repeat protein [Bacteroidales bacterium]